MEPAQNVLKRLLALLPNSKDEIPFWLLVNFRKPAENTLQHQLSPKIANILNTDTISTLKSLLNTINNQDH